MNRIAGRALFIWALVLVLIGGTVFFIGEYATSAEDWIVFPGSPHVYNGGKLASVVTDRDGTLLADFTDERTYSGDAAIRQAMLHWTGDREGNISTPFLGNYALEMTGFDLLNGVYTYGEGGRIMELTLSAQVQRTAMEALDGRHGTVAVYNYRTGELLCAVSGPSFDPDNVPDLTQDTEGAYDGVYLNRFLQSSYIPGSIFKVVTTAAALETMPDILDQTFYCEQVYEMEGGDVTCEGWHGEQDLEQALANSCNCAFAQLTERLGGETLERYVRQFLVTEPVEFDGMSTVSGNYEQADAAPVNVAWSGIGQYHDLINPCRFLTFIGAVAGGGSGAEPHVVKSITVGGKTTYTGKTQMSSRLMSKATAQTLGAYMENNVRETYGAENFPGLTVCAKSGTAETGEDREPNAMFAGFVADEEYPLAFIVVVEEGGHGPAACVPILSQVLSACKEEMDR